MGTGVKWSNWIVDPGTNNLQDPFEGGEPNVTPYAVLDLSALASSLLGRQVPQSAQYRLRGVTVGFRNHDDTIVTHENHAETAFQGVVKWYTPTEHALKALSLARQIEREQEGDEVDGDSFLLSTDKDYGAVRFGWSGDDDVEYQTSHTIGGLFGDYWDLQSVRTAYNSMTLPSETNALFNGRFPDRSSIGWNAQVASGDFTGQSTNANNSLGGGYDYNRTDLYHEVLAGLMMIDIQHSTIAAPHGAFEDDYQWYVGIDFEVIV